MCTSASVIYLPLVKANAFIGLEQFNERKRSIFEEAVRLSIKLSSTSNSKQSFDDSSELDRPNGVGDEDLSPQKKQRLTIATGNSKRKFEEPSTLVRCNAIIGLELLSANVKQLNGVDRLNADFGSDRPSKRRRRNIEPTSTKRKPDESFPLYRCNQAIGPDLFSENWEQAIETTMLELPNSSFSFMNDSQSFTNAVIAKSKKMQLWNVVIGRESLSANKQRRIIEISSKKGPSTLVRCNAVVGPGLLQENANETTMLEITNTPPMNSSESFTNDVIAKSKKMKLPIADCNTKPEEPSTLVRCNAIIGLGLLPENWEQSDGTTTNELPASPPVDNNATFTSAAIAKSRQMQRTLPIQRIIRMQEAIQEWNAYFGTQYTIL